MATRLLAFNELAPKFGDRYFPLLQRQLSCVTFQYGQFINPNPKDLFERRVKSLQENIADINASDGRRIQGELALNLGWLDATGQAPELVWALRSRYMQPNLQFSLSSSFIQQIANRPPQCQTRPVDENILGRQIYGTAAVTNQVQLELVDDPNQAHISIHLTGNIQSNSYTRQGPITAYSNSHAMIEARRSVLANVGGIIEYAPYTAANLNSQFAGVDCIRIVEKIAYQQYLRDKGASEAIAARCAECRLQNEFAAQTDEIIQRGKDRMNEAFTKNRQQLAKLPSMYIHTDRNQLDGVALKTDTFQLSAVDRPPAVFSSPPDVAVQVHESFIDNWIEPYLARQTVKNTEIADKIEAITGRRPENFQENPGDNWSITFSATRPIQVVFEENRLSVLIIGNRFMRDDRPVNEPMSIRINLRPVRENGIVRFERDGDVAVDFVSKGVKPANKTAFKSFLEDVLNKSLREHAQPNNDQGSAGANSEPLKLYDNLLPLDRFRDPRIPRDLQLTVFRAENGWLTAGWRYMPGSSTAAPGSLNTMPVDTPVFDAMPTRPADGQPQR